MSASLSEKALRVLGINQDRQEKTENQAKKKNIAVTNKSKPAPPPQPIQGLIIYANTTSGPSMDRFPIGALPSAYRGTLCTLEQIAFDQDVVENTEWKTAALTVRLGFPLKFARSRWTPDNRIQAYNSQSHFFMIFVNEQSDDFGKFAVSPADGDVVVICADGKPLAKHELAIMTDYVARFVAEGVKGLPDLKEEPSADRKVCTSSSIFVMMTLADLPCRLGWSTTSIPRSSVSTLGRSSQSVWERDRWMRKTRRIR